MKLTSREQEIVDILSQDPRASQEDLATRFGISRSSVAVHISNLMKKGVIVRDMNAWGLQDYIRVTIGTPAENKRFLKVLKEIL